MKKLLAYQISGQTIGFDIETWNESDLSGNPEFIAIDENEPIPAEYVDISSIINWCNYGNLTTLTDEELKNEIILLSSIEDITENERKILTQYSIIPDTNKILIGLCELIDKKWEQNINSITPVALTWEEQDIIDDNFYTHITGTSRIYIKKTGYYEVSYNVNSYNNTNNRATSGVQIRYNGSQLVGKSLSASYSRNGSNDDNHNSIPACTMYLNENDYIEIVGFRLGDDNDIYTKPKGSFVRLKYLGG